MLEQKVEKFLAQYFRSGGSAFSGSLKVLVGVSGGPDSAALLHALLGLNSVFYHIEIQVAHLNHLLRGEDAQEDARYVEDICRQNGLVSHIREFDVGAFSRKNKISLEDAARRARFSFFAQLMGQLEIPLLLLAHTADDQAETVLMHLLRGSGPGGLAGMAPLSSLLPPDPNLSEFFDYNLPFLEKALVGRPLLEVWRTEIEHYCVSSKIIPRLDESNNSMVYFRNRIRHELLPYIEENFKPSFRKGVNRLAILARDEQIWLDNLTEAYFTENAISLKESKVEFSRRFFFEQPVALRRRLLRRAYRELTGSLDNIEAEHLELLAEEKIKLNLKTELPGGIVGYFTKEVVGLRKPFLYTRAGEQSYLLSVPGRVQTAHWSLEAEVALTYPDIEASFRENCKNKAYLDVDKVGSLIIIRFRKPGEKFRPLGAPGRRKVQDLMVDAKIAQELRDHWPILIKYPAEIGSENVETPEPVIWLPGVAIAEQFKVTSDTKSVLVLKFSYL